MTLLWVYHVEQSRLIFDSSIRVLTCFHKERGRRLEELDLPDYMTKLAGELWTTPIED